MIINFAERAHNHNWELDPIIRSLLDTDFYKLLMLQFIWKHFPRTRVTFSVVNRGGGRPAGRHVFARGTNAPDGTCAASALPPVGTGLARRQHFLWPARHFRTRFPRMAGAGFSVYPIMRFRSTTDNTISRSRATGSRRRCGSFTRSPSSANCKTRASLKNLREFGLDILYARAKTKLWSKIERLRGVPDLMVADFGTRRRHSFLWQEYVVIAMAANLGAAFTGTSNAFLAHKHDLEAIGTNAHEIPMVLAALAPDDEALKNSQYKMLELWQQTYDGALRIMLPDTFGTTQFLEERAGVGGGLDRSAHRQQESVYCGG